MRHRGLGLSAPLLGTAAVAIWLFIFQYGGSNRLRDVDAAASLTNGGDAGKGEQVISSVGCGGCHEISGIPDAHGKIAAPLTGFKERAMIAGVMANSSENLIRWLMNPREVDAKTAMPNLNLTEQQARDVAAYLYSH